MIGVIAMSRKGEIKLRAIFNGSDDGGQLVINICKGICN